MALAKYAEDNLEMFYERMATRDLPLRQTHDSQGCTVQTAATIKNGNDAFRTISNGKSCIF